jgi:hypothetical protein
MHRCLRYESHGFTLPLADVLGKALAVVFIRLRIVLRLWDDGPHYASAVDWDLLAYERLGMWLLQLLLIDVDDGWMAHEVWLLFHDVGGRPPVDGCESLEAVDNIIKVLLWIRHD